VLPALGVLALVGLVAIAARGSTPTGSGATRRAALNSLLDVVVSVAVVLFVVAAVYSIYMLTRRDELAMEYSGRRARGFGIMYAFLFVAITAALVRHFSGTSSQNLRLNPTGIRPRRPPTGSTTDHAPPHVLWLPVVAAVLLIGVAVASALISDRRRRRSLSPGQEDVAESLAAVLEDTLDDLRRERDPRRAVIAAYARLERVLAAYGLPRQPSETAEEYVARILASLDVDEGAIRWLTSLFMRAKFSQHDVDVAMKEEAIAALVRVRDELRAAGLASEVPAALEPVEGHAG
jgi:Domain of unknown function (DUF4129)